MRKPMLSPFAKDSHHHPIATNELGYSAEVIKRSRKEGNGVDDVITTYRLRYPRFILAEVNTHKVLCKSSASSRAIPAKRLRKQVLDEPALPIYWGANQSGMQAKRQLSGLRLYATQFVWRKFRYLACAAHWLMEKAGLHKQLCNRVIEPWMFTTTILTGVHWLNFYGLRKHPDAQPEFYELARLMATLDYVVAVPLRPGEWHIPFDPEDNASIERAKAAGIPILNQLTLQQRLLYSAACCARTSYDNHDGSVPTMEKNLALANDLHAAMPPHMSPFEHQACAMPTSAWYANYQGWKQSRAFMQDGTLNSITQPPTPVGYTWFGILSR